MYRVLGSNINMVYVSTARPKTSASANPLDVHRIEVLPWKQPHPHSSPNPNQMYIIIICATLPTLRQSYFAVLSRSTHASSSYNNFTHSAKSVQKQKPIPRPRRPVDASLFETRMTNFQEEPGPVHQHTSSQEHILPGEEIDLSAIKKTTEVHVYQEDRSDSSNANPYFPRENPFRSSS